MIKYLLALTAGAYLLVASSAFAVPYTTDDFSQSASISDATTSLRQIQIPKTLYQEMHRRDYGDLRVFSADGQIVPHQFSQSSTRLDSKQETPLVFYPFSKEQAANPGNIQVIINQKAGEQNLRINQQLSDNTNNSSNKNGSKRNEYQYIIENRSDNNNS